jgi:hypothetical protein
MITTATQTSGVRFPKRAGFIWISDLGSTNPTAQRSDIQNPKYYLLAGYFSESLTIFHIVNLTPQALMKYYEKSDQPSLPTL